MTSMYVYNEMSYVQSCILLEWMCSHLLTDRVTRKVWIVGGWGLWRAEEREKERERLLITRSVTVRNGPSVCKVQDSGHLLWQQFFGQLSLSVSQPLVDWIESQRALKVSVPSGSDKQSGSLMSEPVCSLSVRANGALRCITLSDGEV